MYHIHPEDWNTINDNDLVFKVYVNIPRTGNYILAVDLLCNASTPIPGTASFNFTAIAAPGTILPSLASTPLIQNNAAQKLIPVGPAPNDRFVDPIYLDAVSSSTGYTFSLSINMDNPWQYNWCSHVMFTILDSAGNLAINDFEPILTMGGHLALVDHQIKDRIVHTHAMAPSDMPAMPNSLGLMQQFEATTNCSAMTMIPYPSNTRFGPELMSMITLPRPGTWQLILQMKHTNGQMYVGQWTVQASSYVPLDTSGPSSTAKSAAIPAVRVPGLLLLLVLLPFLIL